MTLDTNGIAADLYLMSVAELQAASWTLNLLREYAELRAAALAYADAGWLPEQRKATDRANDLRRLLFTA